MAKQVKIVADDLQRQEIRRRDREGNAIRDYYPDYVEPGSVYEFLADAYEAKATKRRACKELEKYSSGRRPQSRC